MDIPSQMKTREIKLVDEFTDSPGGRTRDQGEYSGQEFREELLAPALADEAIDRITVNLDGALGLPSSFLDEAFGATAAKYPSAFRKVRFVITDNEVAIRILEDCISKQTSPELAELVMSDCSVAS